jgi:hypothetical protein
MGDGTTDLAHLHFFILIYLFFYPSGNKVHQLAAFKFQLPLIFGPANLKIYSHLKKNDFSYQRNTSKIKNLSVGLNMKVS